VPVEVVKEVIVYKDAPPKEVIKYVDREVIKEVPVEVIKYVDRPVETPQVVTQVVEKEVIREVPRDVIKYVEGPPSAESAWHGGQHGCCGCCCEKQIEVVEKIKEVKVDVIKEKPVEVIKYIEVEVPVEVIREVTKTIEVPVEVIVEKVVEKIVEKKVEVPVQIIREVPVEVVRECQCCAARPLECAPASAPPSHCAPPMPQIYPMHQLQMPMPMHHVPVYQPPPFGYEAPMMQPVEQHVIEPVQVLDERPRPEFEVVREVPHEALREIQTHVPIELEPGQPIDIPVWKRELLERQIEERRRGRERRHDANFAKPAKPYRISDRANSAGFSRQPDVPLPSHNGHQRFTSTSSHGMLTGGPR